MQTTDSLKKDVASSLMLNQSYPEDDMALLNFVCIKLVVLRPAYSSLLSNKSRVLFENIYPAYAGICILKLGIHVYVISETGILNDFQHI